MNRRYKIEVNLTAPYRGASAKPYYWILWSSNRDGGDLGIENSGWSTTPEEAWNTAYNYYKDNILGGN